MAINRGPWNALVDDDGSNLTGSLWNKAAIATTILDPIDALYPAQTWVPVDVSGASLAFVIHSARYVRIGPLIALFATFAFPSTSNGAAAQIGNLPAAAVGTSGLYAVYGIQTVPHLASGSSVLQPLNPATNAAMTNAQFSGSLVSWAGVYLAA